MRAAGRRNNCGARQIKHLELAGCRLIQLNVELLHQARVHLHFIFQKFLKLGRGVGARLDGLLNQFLASIGLLECCSDFLVQFIDDGFRGAGWCKGKFGNSATFAVNVLFTNSKV